MCAKWTVASYSGHREAREEVISVVQARGEGGLVLGCGARGREKEEDVSEFSSPLVTVSSHDEWMLW